MLAHEGGGRRWRSSRRKEERLGGGGQGLTASAGPGKDNPIEKMMNMMEERERMMESLLLSLLLSLSQPQWDEAKRPERTRDRQAS